MNEKIKNEFEESLKGYWINPCMDYRLELSHFRVNKHGDLLINRGSTKHNDGWEIFIPKERLTESDWISDISTEDHRIFGEFVCAYLKALEVAGVKNLNISIYGFDDSFKYADGA